MRRTLKISIIIFLIVSVNGISAQNLYLSNVLKSELVINGTSTLHDWHMDSKNFECSVNATNEKNMLTIQNVNFSCNSTSLKSENSLMDKKAWDALKTNNFKTIVFKSDEQTDFVLKDNKIEGTLDGEFILAGAKRIIALPFKGEFDELGNLNLKGEIKVKMSEYGITPPTALMGSIKTGDEITVVFNVSFNPSETMSKN